MLSELAKEMFMGLKCPYVPVAIKFCFAVPEGAERAEKVMALCSFIKEAQVTGKKFYTDVNNDDCMGKMMLGMIDIPPFEGSGQAGFDFEVFRTPAANARLYHMMPRLVRGACNYVLFCPVDKCDFDPDLIVCTADVEQADLLMRANSYISGDLWESKDSHVAGCSWLLVYPYVSGKINHAMTGIHHGQKRRKPYPEGLQLISVPYQKIDEVVLALSQMPRVPIAMRAKDGDESAERELDARMAKWHEMDPNVVLKKA
jgi:uncharacterized protein (DUF169 family)